MALEDLIESRRHEMDVYLDSMQAMYANALLQNEELYDIASELTEHFTRIRRDAILADSRIIKILRYATAPSISQMKFGQLFGLSSIDLYENERTLVGGPKYGRLTAIADQIADFVTQRLDRARFIWLTDSLSASELSLAKTYAKKWTCAIAADQNAQTRYRNWRREQQEHVIESELIRLGYTRSSSMSSLSQATDLGLGEYTREIKIRGRTIQKADLVVRSKKSRKLVLIEAKSVGVEIDAIKRVKECCDKASDWQSSGALEKPIVVAIIAGFFSSRAIENLQASNIRVIWEHRLTDLSDLL
jgi:hypothetical protein